MTLVQLLLYVCSLWFYAAVWGADFVMAVGSRRRESFGNVPTGAAAALFAGIDRSLSTLRIIAIFTLACFAISRLPISSATWLTCAAILFLGLRRAIPNATETSAHRGVPVQSARAVISAIGMFYVIAAGTVR